MKRLHVPVISALLVFFLAIPLSAQIRTESFRGRDAVSGEVIVRFRTATVAQSEALVAQDADLTFAQPVGQTGAVLVRSRGRDLAALMQAYQARQDVLYVEPNYIWQALDLPNDQFFSEQYGLMNTGQTLKTPFVSTSGTSGADISARQAWDITEGSRSIVVGVVDTGVDYTHPDLAANMWSAPRPFTVTIGGQTITCAEGTHGFNAITRTCDPMDDVGHGTHVAGIIAASGNNGAGVSGVSRIGSMISAKFLGPSGGSTVDAIAALEFLIQVKWIFGAAANVRVLNNSWGGGAASQALLEQINLTYASDMLFVAAAGNSALNNDLSANYPSNYSTPNMLAVASTDNRDALASSSDWGFTSVHLGAPGVNVLSTYPNGTYAYNSGTSMASPMVAGAAALVLSVCPLPTAALKQSLMTSVDRVPSLSGRAASEGRLNVYRAISSCAPGTSAGLALSVSPGAPRLDRNASIDLTVTATSFAAVNLTTVGLPNGVTATFTPSFIASGTGSSTLRLTAGANAPEGTYLVGITGTSGSVSRTTGVLLTVGSPSIVVGQTIAGTLTAADGASLDRTGKHADFYKLTLTSPTAVTIDLKSRYFDPILYVLSSTGAVLFTDDQLGGLNNARITQTLAAGTYFLEVTSFSDGATGGYTLSINTPTISSITPSAGFQGSTVTLALVGTRFLAPMTLSAGPGIVVNNVTVLSPTTATASLTISNAPFSPLDLTVTTSEGTSNPVTFIVATPMSIGQRISGQLSSTDRVSPPLPYRYTDVYQLTVSTTTTITVNVSSPSIGAFPILISAAGLNLAQGVAGSTSTITATIAPGPYVVQVTAGLNFATGDYSLGINMPNLTSITPVFVEQGADTNATLVGTRFASTMTVNAGAGITSSNVNVTSPALATATLTTAGDAAVGPRNITVTTPEGVSNPDLVWVVPPIPSLTVGQPRTGTLSSTDPPSALYALVPQLPAAYTSANSYADVYKITVPTTTTVAITLQSARFNPVLSLWTAAGPGLYSDDFGNSSSSRITTTLTGGVTYFIEATSLVGATGDYTLLVTPLNLTLVTPNIGVRGATVNVSLLGTGFTSPMTIAAGPGITASAAIVQSSTSATVTLTIAADAALGARELRATTSAGTTNPATFTVLPSLASIPVINLGDTLSGALASNDQPAPHRAGQYADFYQLTIAAQSPVNIDMKSADVNAYVYLLSSTGAVLGFDDNSGGGNDARVGALLSPGTYLIEATSSVADIGNYTISATLAPPVITSSLPANGAPGTVVDVTLRGQFFIAPVTLDAGAGITVSNVNVVNGTTLTARFSIAADASLGDRPVTATSAFGVGDPMYFTVTAASVLNFPRLSTALERRTMGFAIVNPGPSNAAVTFTMYSAAGVQLGVSNQSVPAKGQFARVGSELFPTVVASGWVQATSSTPGLQALWLGGDFTTTMDGADAAPFNREVIFPLINVSAINGEVNIANVSSAVNTVTLRVYSTTGPEIAPPVTVTIPPNGVFRSPWVNVFPSGVGLPSYMKATGTRNIAGTSVMPNYLITPSWSVLNGINTARQVMEINFPHVPSGGTPAWTSMLGVVNMATAAQTVTITFTPNTGSPIVRTRLLLAGQPLLESVQTIFGFSPAVYQEGWVKVTGPQPLNGFIFYGVAGSAGTTTVPGQTTARTQMMFDHVATGSSWNTGLALLNNTATDANVEIYIMRSTGALVGSASFVLPKGTKIAKNLPEWIPASTFDDGFVYVRTTNNVPLYGIELFYSRDNRVIANIPAAEIDPSITFTPPAP